MVVVQGHLLLRSIIRCLVLGLLAALLVPASGQQYGKGSVCFVVRTFQGHDVRYAINTLSKLLSSLLRQSDPRWHARVLVMDALPFVELSRILKAMSDERIQLFAEWVGSSFRAKEATGDWSPTYHHQLYNLTDIAIRLGCQWDATWVVVTNGDNLYDSEMVSSVLSSPPGSDAVSVDYYSRYQRPTMDPCTRFEATPDAPPCKTNEMRVCHVDLAAVAWRRQRMLDEDRRFGTVDKMGNGVAADGVMAQAVAADGWKVHHLSGRCLVHHNPTPQLCAAQGFVWDDSAMDQADMHGGTCRHVDEMKRLAAASPDNYEVVNISVSYDPNSFTFPRLEGRSLPLTCYRRADRGSWQHREVFGRVCSTRQDLPQYPAYLGAHPWDVFLPEDLKTM